MKRHAWWTISLCCIGLLLGACGGALETDPVTLESDAGIAAADGDVAQPVLDASVASDASSPVPAADGSTELPPTTPVVSGNLFGLYRVVVERAALRPHAATACRIGGVPLPVAYIWLSSLVAMLDECDIYVASVIGNQWNRSSVGTLSQTSIQPGVYEWGAGEAVVTAKLSELRSALELKIWDDDLLYDMPIADCTDVLLMQSLQEGRLTLLCTHPLTHQEMAEVTVRIDPA